MRKKSVVWQLVKGYARLQQLKYLKWQYDVLRPNISRFKESTANLYKQMFAQIKAKYSATQFTSLAKKFSETKPKSFVKSVPLSTKSAPGKSTKLVPVQKVRKTFNRKPVNVLTAQKTPNNGSSASNANPPANISFIDNPVILPPENANNAMLFSSTNRNFSTVGGKGKSSGKSGDSNVTKETKVNQGNSKGTSNELGDSKPTTLSKDAKAISSGTKGGSSDLVSSKQNQGNKDLGKCVINEKGSSNVNKATTKDDKGKSSDKSGDSNVTKETKVNQGISNELGVSKPTKLSKDAIAISDGTKKGASDLISSKLNQSNKDLRKWVVNEKGASKVNKVPGKDAKGKSSGKSSYSNVTKKTKVNQGIIGSKGRSIEFRYSKPTKLSKDAKAFSRGTKRGSTDLVSSKLNQGNKDLGKWVINEKGSSNVSKATGKDEKGKSSDKSDVSNVIKATKANESSSTGTSNQLGNSKPTQLGKDTKDVAKGNNATIATKLNQFSAKASNSSDIIKANSKGTKATSGDITSKLNQGKDGKGVMNESDLCRVWVQTFGLAEANKVSKNALFLSNAKQSSSASSGKGDKGKSIDSNVTKTAKVNQDSAKKEFERKINAFVVSKLIDVSKGGKVSSESKEPTKANHFIAKASNESDIPKAISKGTKATSGDIIPSKLNQGKDGKGVISESEPSKVVKDSYNGLFLSSVKKNYSATLEKGGKEKSIVNFGDSNVNKKIKVNQGSVKGESDASKPIQVSKDVKEVPSKSKVPTKASQCNVKATSSESNKVPDNKVTKISDDTKGIFGFMESEFMEATKVNQDLLKGISRDFDVVKPSDKAGKKDTKATSSESVLNVAKAKKDIKNNGSKKASFNSDVIEVSKANQGGLKGKSSDLYFNHYFGVPKQTNKANINDAKAKSTETSVPKVNQENVKGTANESKVNKKVSTDFFGRPFIDSHVKKVTKAYQGGLKGTPSSFDVSKLASKVSQSVAKSTSGESCVSKQVGTKGASNESGVTKVSEKAFKDLFGKPSIDINESKITRATSNGVNKSSNDKKDTKVLEFQKNSAVFIDKHMPKITKSRETNAEWINDNNTQVAKNIIQSKDSRWKIGTKGDVKSEWSNKDITKVANDIIQSKDSKWKISKYLPKAEAKKVIPMEGQTRSQKSKETTNAANERIRVGFIGSGNIAYAICSGLLNSGYVKANQIFATAPSNDHISKFKDFGCNTTNDNSKVFQMGNSSNESQKSSKPVYVMFICVKPHIPLKLVGFWDFLTTQTFISSISSSPLIIISTLAGVPLSTLKTSIDSHFKNSIPYQIHLARIMPNTACGVNAGAIGLSLHDSAQPVSNEIATILRQLGYCQVVNEDQLDAVVGVAGSGIAFVYSMIQAMADGGVLMGLTRETAVQFAAQTVAGAAEMVLKSGQGPIELRNNVCSPGGTTINGLVNLEKGAFNATVMGAIEAATKKSREFSKLSSPK